MYNTIGEPMERLFQAFDEIESAVLAARQIWLKYKLARDALRAGALSEQ